MNFIQNIEQILKANWEAILEHFKKIELRNVNYGPLPIYHSIDLRESKFKIAPVDSNLFPAGFNNIANYQEIIHSASLAFKEYLNSNAKIVNTHADAQTKQKILLIADKITHNEKYLSNVATLKKILEISDYDVEVGYIDEINEEEMPEMGNIVVRDGSLLKLKSKDFIPDIIILNHDMTAGLPPLLTDIMQPIFPDIKYGWHTRSKFNFLQKYSLIIEEIAKKFNFDPWFLTTFTDLVEDVAFKEKIGFEKLAESVDDTLKKIQEKYKEYGIKNEPYVFIKPDNGTHGLGIITANSGEEIVNLNKKTRHSINKIKFGIDNKKIIVQEGIISNINFSLDQTSEKFSAEKILYCINNKVIASLIRYNKNKDNKSNLNSQNMEITMDINQQKISYVENLIMLASEIAANA